MRRLLLACLLLLPFSAFADKAEDQLVRKTVYRMRQGDGGPKPLGTLDQRAIPELIRILDETTEITVFLPVARRLFELRATASIPVLIRSLGRPMERSAVFAFEPAALTILERWSWQAVNGLIKGLDSANGSIRYGCAELLAARARYRPSDRRLLPIYRRLTLETDPSMKKIGYTSLWSLASFTRYDRTNSTLLPAEILNQEAFRAFVELAMHERGIAGDEMTKMLEDYVWGNAGLRYDQPRPKGTSDEARDKYRELCKSDRPEMRMAALALLDANGGLNRVIYDAIEDTDPGVRHIAVEIFMCHPEWGPPPFLVARATSPRPEVRLCIAKVLRTWRGNVTEAALLKLTNDSDPGVRKEAKQSLAILRGDYLLKASATIHPSKAPM